MTLLVQFDQLIKLFLLSGLDSSKSLAAYKTLICFNAGDENRKQRVTERGDGEQGQQPNAR